MFGRPVTRRRHLDRAVDRLGARVAEEHLRVGHPRHEAAQALGELDGPRVVRHHRRVHQRTELRLRGRDDTRVAMTDVRDRDARREVEPPPPVDVGEPRAAAFDRDDVGDARQHAGERSLVALEPALGRSSFVGTALEDRHRELPHLGVRVDLGLLQPARVVDVHRLDLAELLDASGAGLAEPVAGVLRAAERQRDLGADRRCVDVHDAGVDAVDELQRRVDVARVDRGGQPVLGRVDDVDGLVLVADLDHREHGTEHLFAGDRVVGTHTGQHRRSDERTALAAVDLEQVPSGHDGRALARPHARSSRRCARPSGDRSRARRRSWQPSDRRARAPRPASRRLRRPRSRRSRCTTRRDVDVQR